MKRLLTGLGALLIAGLLIMFFIQHSSASGTVGVVTMEAGDAIPDISEFLKEEHNDAQFVTDMSAIPANQPGTYDVELLVGKKQYSSKLEINDTIAPVAEPVNHNIWPEEKLEPADFVRNIADISEVTISYEKQPDFNKAGLQNVSIVLKDASGNQSVVKATLTIKSDTEPPTIAGVEDQTIFVGDKISYKNNVVVTDNRDENVELEVDNSAVDLKKVGAYQVVYTATDTAGNVATVTATITVREKPADYVDPEEMYRMADNILAKIIKEDMSDVDKAWAIYKWTRSHIGYVSTHDTEDWLMDAKQGLTKGTGDCYVFYAVSRLLLERTGFETQPVERNGGRATKHIWSLVNIEGDWYHYDTTPTIKKTTSFLLTDEETDHFDKNIYENYYNFDKTKHPATPTDPPEERSKYIK